MKCKVKSQKEPGAKYKKNFDPKSRCNENNVANITVYDKTGKLTILESYQHWLLSFLTNSK